MDVNASNNIDSAEVTLTQRKNSEVFTVIKTALFAGRSTSGIKT